MKGLDTYNNIADKAAALKADGFDFVARYLFTASNFKEPFLKSEALAIEAEGLELVSVWENGKPTGPGYFTSARGSSDALGAIHAAKLAGQPTKTSIYFAVDYDAEPSSVVAYFRALDPIVVEAGYVVGVYGSGAVCSKLRSLNLVAYTWLAQSRGWRGYDEFLSFADIIQGPAEKIHGLDVDSDSTGRTSDDEYGNWAPGSVNNQPSKPTVDTGNLATLPALAIGQSGSAVSALQAALSIAHGIDVDGEFGPKTAESLRAFQEKTPSIIHASGVTDGATWAALAEKIGKEVFDAIFKSWS